MNKIEKLMRLKENLQSKLIQSTSSQSNVMKMNNTADVKECYEERNLPSQDELIGVTNQQAEMINLTKKSNSDCIK